MAKFDHRFWEISVNPNVLESALVEPDFLQKLLAEDCSEEHLAKRELQQKQLLAELKAIISSHLTDKQREIIELYYFQDKTQQEIASLLGLPQQVISKHLFGVIRDGKRVGGAIAKIRKFYNKLEIESKVGVKKS